MPEQHAVQPKLHHGLAEDRQFADQVGAHVAAAFVVGHVPQSIEGDGDQVEPRRPVGVQRGLGIAGNLGDARVRDGIGTLIGQHAEGGPGDVCPRATDAGVLTAIGCHHAFTSSCWLFVVLVAGAKITDERIEQYRNIYSLLNV